MPEPEVLWREFPLDPAPPAGDPAPTPAPSPGALGAGTDGRITLPGGASVTFPEGTERSIGTVPAAQAQGEADELVAISGQAGAYVVVVAILVVLMARWLLNHTWRASLTVAVMLLGAAAFALILVRWATDLGILS